MSKCRPSTYGVIRGQRIYYGFRCPRHGIAAGGRYGSWESLKVAIRNHRKEFSAKKKH